jgi:predicted ATPase
MPLAAAKADPAGRAGGAAVGEARMRDLDGFRAAVREYRREAGRTQQHLARAVGLHPNVLSHKLNGHHGAVLTTPEVIGVVIALAGWGALAARADAEALLASMGVPPHALPAGFWTAPPMAALAGEAAGPARLLPLPAAPARTVPGLAQGAAGPRRLVVAPLPAPRTALIGRERERAEVAAALAASRLVTLTGAGGVGKTRLALQVASELAGGFADGAAFADLAPVSDPALAATAVAAALGLHPPSAGAAEERLACALYGKDLLLVLDNLEHLVEEMPLLPRLLAVAPALRILTTSRIALRLYGEHTVRVPPLHLGGDGAGGGVQDSEAVRLFVARAGAAGQAPGRDVGELAAVAAICTALDGLPLAIELAAARVRLYPPQALLPLLESRLALLTGGPRDLPSRQQTMRATLDWSYQLLPGRVRHLFACLGVFAGPFDAAAAAAVSGQDDTPATLGQLAELADQSMLEIAPAAAPRFRSLQIVREYALARLAETDEQDEVRRRHLAHYLDAATAAGTSITGPELTVRLELLETAYPNIRAALEFACLQAGHDGACLDEGLRLATAVSILWRRRGPLAEGTLLLGRLLALDDARQRAADPRIRAAAVIEACALACFSIQYQAAAEYGRDGVQLCGSLGDRQGLAKAHRFLAEAAAAAGDFNLARSHCEQAITAARASGSLRDQAAARNILGQVYRYLGDLSRARPTLRQAVREFTGGSDPDGAAHALHSLGEAERDAGHTTLAGRLFTTALRSHDAHGNKRGMAFDLEGLAGIACLDGAWRQALIYLGAAQELRHQTGAQLAPVEQADLTRITQPALAAFSPRERQEILAQGRDQPLADTLAMASTASPRPILADFHAANPPLGG